MTREQIIDLAALRIHPPDGVTEFVFIGGKGAAFEHGDLQRIHTQDLLQILVVLIQIAEVDTQLILQDADADGAVEEMIALQLHVEMQIGTVVLGVFLLGGPGLDGQTGQIDGLIDGFFGDSKTLLIFARFSVILL